MSNPMRSLVLGIKAEKCMFTWLRMHRCAFSVEWIGESIRVMGDFSLLQCLYAHLVSKKHYARICACYEKSVGSTGGM